MTKHGTRKTKGSPQLEADINSLNTLSEEILQFIRNYEKKGDDVNQGYLDMLYKWKDTLIGLRESLETIDRLSLWEKINKDIKETMRRDSEVGTVILYVPVKRSGSMALFDYRQML